MTFILFAILFICELCFSRSRVVFIADMMFGLLGFQVVTQAILILLFSCGVFLFLSSSCWIFFALLIPSSMRFSG